MCGRFVLGTELDAGELSSIDTFTGFDFENVWMIDNTAESVYRYPQLKDVPYEGEIKTYSLKECQVTDIKIILLQLVRMVLLSQ